MPLRVARSINMLSKNIQNPIFPLAFALSSRGRALELEGVWEAILSCTTHTGRVEFVDPPQRGRSVTPVAHSQVKSGPVSRSNGAAQCAIVRSIRTRTTSHDLDGRSKKLEPKHARAKSAKRSKKSKKSRKTKENPCGPWPSLSSAVYCRKSCRRFPDG